MFDNAVRNRVHFARICSLFITHWEAFEPRPARVDKITGLRSRHTWVQIPALPFNYMPSHPGDCGNQMTAYLTPRALAVVHFKLPLCTPRFSTTWKSSFLWCAKQFLAISIHTQEVSSKRISTEHEQWPDNQCLEQSPDRYGVFHTFPVSWGSSTSSVFS